MADHLIAPYLLGHPSSRVPPDVPLSMYIHIRVFIHVLIMHLNIKHSLSYRNERQRRECPDHSVAVGDRLPRRLDAVNMEYVAPINSPHASNGDA